MGWSCACDIVCQTAADTDLARTPCIQGPFNPVSILIHAVLADLPTPSLSYSIPSPRNLNLTIYLSNFILLGVHM